jgi:hypothetical protein
MPITVFIPGRKNFLRFVVYITYVYKYSVQKYIAGQCHTNPEPAVPD